MFEERFDVGKQVVGDDLVAARCGVDVVGLHHALNAVNIFEQEGHERHVEAVGEGGVVAGEVLDVVGAVVGRKGDTGEDDFGSGGLEVGEHLGKIGAGGSGVEAAETVVAAELEDDDGRMKCE